MTPLGALDAYMIKEAQGPLATTTRHAELVSTRSCWSQRPVELGRSWRRIDVTQNSRVSWKWKMQESNVRVQRKTSASQWRARGQSPILSVQMSVSSLAQPRILQTHHRRPKVERRRDRSMRTWGSPSNSLIEKGLRTIHAGTETDSNQPPSVGCGDRESRTRKKEASHDQWGSDGS